MEKAWKKLGNNVSVGDGSRGMDDGGGGGDDCCGEEGCPEDKDRGRYGSMGVFITAVARMKTSGNQPHLVLIRSILWTIAEITTMMCGFLTIRHHYHHHCRPLHNSTLSPYTSRSASSPLPATSPSLSYPSSGAKILRMGCMLFRL